MLACDVFNPIYNAKYGSTMANTVKISNELFENAKLTSKIFKRSIAAQVEYWAKIGQMTDECNCFAYYVDKRNSPNPDETSYYIGFRCVE